MVISGIQCYLSNVQLWKTELLKATKAFYKFWNKTWPGHVLKKGFVTTTPPWQKLRLHSCVVCISFFKEANKHSLISDNEDKSESALRRQHAQPRHSQAEINSSLHCAYFRAPRGFKYTNRRAFHTWRKLQHHGLSTKHKQNPLFHFKRPIGSTLYK